MDQLADPPLRKSSVRLGRSFGLTGESAGAFREDNKSLPRVLHPTRIALFPCGFGFAEDLLKGVERVLTAWTGAAAGQPSSGTLQNLRDLCRPLIEVLRSRHIFDRIGEWQTNPQPPRRPWPSARPRIRGTTVVRHCRGG